MATNKDKEKQEQEQETTTPATPDPTEEAKKEAKAILDAANAEAEKIKKEAMDKAEADAKAAFEARVAEMQAAAAAAPAAPAKPKMVNVRLFKDNGRYKDDVFVAVNGKTFQIKRGEEVEVPDYVYEVLERQDKQDQATANLITRQSEEYAAEAARRGL